MISRRLRNALSSFEKHPYFYKAILQLRSSTAEDVAPVMARLGEVLEAPIREAMSALDDAEAADITVMVWALLHSDQVPQPDQRLSWPQKLHESRHLIPVVLLIAAVLGSIYAGIATATEAAAVGVVGIVTVATIRESRGIDLMKDEDLGPARAGAADAPADAPSAVPGSEALPTPPPAAPLV